jgi:hypothetical protein
MALLADCPVCHGTGLVTAEEHDEIVEAARFRQEIRDDLKAAAVRVVAQWDREDGPEKNDLSDEFRHAMGQLRHVLALRDPGVSSYDPRFGTYGDLARDLERQLELGPE